MKYTKHLLLREYLFILFLLSITVFITSYELKVLQNGLYLKKAVTKEIDYEAFRNLKLGEDTLNKAELQANRLRREFPDLRNNTYVNMTGCLTYSMMLSYLDLKDTGLLEDKMVKKGISNMAKTKQFQKLYGYYYEILNDLKYFPVPRVLDNHVDISYVDSWYQPRTYGGDRKHEGTDLMASNNKRGFFPVLSITDGTVEKMGWLEQGGYRIGIRAPSGGYFYYAHLASYAQELKEGDTVIAGQLLGFMGDSGYGKEGTTGQFAVHLHLGIYVNLDHEEMSVNPYPILKFLEKNRTVYNHQ